MRDELDIYKLFNQCEDAVAIKLGFDDWGSAKIEWAKKYLISDWTMAELEVKKMFCNLIINNSEFKNKLEAVEFVKYIRENYFYEELTKSWISNKTNKMVDTIEELYVLYKQQNPDEK